MNRTRVLAAFAGCLALSGTLLPLPGQTPSAGIEGQLRSQYQIASVGSNGVVARAGTIVAVQQDGITALPAPQEWPCNTYKQGGRIKQSTLCAVNYSPTKPDTRLLQVGEKAYLTAIQVKPSEVVFKVQTCCGDVSSAPFRATVAFQFQKGYLDSMNAQQIRDTVNGIFAIDTSETGDGPPPPGPQPTQLSGLYFLQQTGAKLQLNPDGSFSLLAANGQVSPGHFTVSSDTLALTYSATGRSSVFRIQGDKFYASSGLAWVRVGDSPQPPPPPPPPPLKLPSTYAKAQTPSDQLQLNDDHTFSLQEAGLRPDHPALFKAARWLLDHQVLGGGDWLIKNPDVEPGGWAFEFRNDFYPDVDDTAFVLMALQRVDYPDAARLQEALRRGTAWVLAMQNRDGG